jgi:glycosyltransferase involved in cell wall biosynthesis
VRYSIIIPTKNEEVDLPRLLDSIRSQSFPMEQVIVVDNASEDKTREIARNSGARVLEGGPNQSAQRNLGATVATQDAFCFLDADMEVEDGLLGEIADLLESGAECIVVPERTIPEDWLGRARAFERDLFAGDSSIEAARIFSRRIFLSLDGYDAGITGGEDWLLSKRASELVALHRTARSIAHYEGRLELAPLVRKYAKYGRGYYSLYRRDASMAVEHANPMRGSIVTSWRTILLQPSRALPLFAYKVITYGAGLVGFAAAALESVLRRLQARATR